MNSSCLEFHSSVTTFSMQPHGSIIVSVSSASEVAVLMANDPVGHRDIVLMQRDNILRRISELHPA